MNSNRNQRFLTICRQLFSSCMVMGLATGVLTHAGRLPMESGVLISTYFIVVTTVMFVVLAKKDPGFAVPPEATDSTYIKVKAGTKLVAGIALVGILFLNTMYHIKMWVSS